MPTATEPTERRLSRTDACTKHAHARTHSFFDAACAYTHAHLEAADSGVKFGRVPLDGGDGAHDRKHLYCIYLEVSYPYLSAIVRATSAARIGPGARGQTSACSRPSEFACRCRAESEVLRLGMCHARVLGTRAGARHLLERAPYFAL